MAETTLFKFEGFQELEAVFAEMENDFGEKDQKKIMVAALKDAMQPVLTTARYRVPVDTGALEASLRIESRKPNNKDKRSRYWRDGQVAVAYLTTAPGNKLAQVSYYNKRMIEKTKNTRTTLPFKSIGMKSDARANVQEFGSAYFPAQPYMRVSLESESATVLNSLSGFLNTALIKYRSKYNKQG